jgi:Ser/Thr protein kinase RdoA (MazF antagonist)
MQPEPAKFTSHLRHQRFETMIATVNDLHPFSQLTPEKVLESLESIGFLTDGCMLALNSYENRVYQVGIEGEQPVIVKFYRPGRWSREQILEEHAFILELAEQDLSVVQPIITDGSSLHFSEPFWFAVYPRRGGRSPDLDNNTLEILGRCLGKLHAVGAAHRFEHRYSFSVEEHGTASCRFLLDNGFIPTDLHAAYTSLTRDLLARIEKLFAEVRGVDIIRLHGDCHTGNILWREGIPHLVDFDDCMNGPAVQDLWMLLSGERSQQEAQLAALMDGYLMFHDFEPRELRLIEALRTLRLMYYAAWLARRWDDPAFPHSFTWFNTQRYWSTHILELREQLAALDEPVLQLQL